VIKEVRDMDDQNNTNPADPGMAVPPPVMPEPVVPEPQPEAGGPLDQVMPPPSMPVADPQPTVEPMANPMPAAPVAQTGGDADEKVMAELHKIEDELQKMEQKSEE